MEVDDGALAVSGSPDDMSFDVDIAQETFVGEEVSTELQEIYAEQAACEALLAQVGVEEGVADIDPYAVPEGDDLTTELEDVYAEAAACEALLAQATQAEEKAEPEKAEEKKADLEEVALRSLKASELQKRAAAAGASRVDIEAAVDDDHDTKVALIKLVLATEQNCKAILRSLKTSELQKRAAVAGATSDEIESALDNEHDSKAALAALVFSKERQPKVSEPTVPEKNNQAERGAELSSSIAQASETNPEQSNTSLQTSEDKEALNSLLGGYGSESDGEVSSDPADKDAGASADMRGKEPQAQTSGAGLKAHIQSDVPFMVSAGCAVQVFGLQNAKELNGLQGIARQLDPGTGRWEVDLKLSSGGSEVKKIRSQNLRAAESIVDVGRGDQGVEGEIFAGCRVRLTGLQKAKDLNGLQGIARQLDGKSGRWHVEVKAADGSVQVKTIQPQNLVIEDCKVDNGSDEHCETGLQQDTPCEDTPCDMEVDHPVVNGNINDDCNEEPLDDMRSNSSDELDDEEEEDAALKVGDVVRIDGLKAAAHLNGQTGTLERFDVEADRWELKLPNGEIKAIKPCNLSLEAKETLVDQTSESSNLPQNVTTRTDAFGSLDDNELAAKALEAELSGDSAMAAKLNAIIDDRRKNQGNVSSSVSTDDGPRVEEMIHVPQEVVGQIIGSKGETIRKLSQDTGARLSFLNTDEDGDNVQVLFARGSATAVAKAKSLVEAAIASMSSDKGGKGKRKGQKGRNRVQEILNGGAAGCDEGVCKWWAAGFCRGRPEPGKINACRNGKHDSTLAVEAEKDWIGQAPAVGSVPPPEKRPVLLLLDLEGGGNKDGDNGEDEIIELPVLALCGSTGKELGRFHRFLRPGYWDREAALMHRKFPASCFNEQSVAQAFSGVVPSLIEYICTVLRVTPETLDSNQFLFITCGNWDIKTALPRQSNKPSPGAPGSVDLATQQLLFSRWCNLKEIFQSHYNLPDDKTPTGMRGMLNRLRIPLSGQHHLGMDDVSNLYKILKHIILEDAVIKPTGFAKNLAADASATATAHAPSFSGKHDRDKGKSGKGSCKKGKFDGKSDFRDGVKGKFEGKSDFRDGVGYSCKGKGSKGKGSGKGKGKKSFDNVPADVMSFAKSSQPSPAHGSQVATGVKRPAADSPPDPPVASVRRKESWNPWDVAETIVEEALPAEQADLKDFLKGAPRPGEDWEYEDSAEEEVSVKSKPQKDGVGLAGVFGNDDANLQSSEPAPAKATSLASLFASLPKPMSTSE